MSGDCEHRWGYHFDGSVGRCYKCNEDTKMLTKDQAQAIIDAHEINMDDGEETETLDENNPELAAAYRVLLAIAAA